MNILELLKRTFSKKEVGIISFSDFVSIPKRENLDRPYLIDEYKKNYISLINENKISSYIDSRLDELKSKIDMYINLLTNSCYSEDLETYSLVNLSKKNVSRKKVNFELLSVKLNVYLNEIKKITSEVDYMLVTLNEILEEKTEKKHNIFYLSSVFNHKHSNSKINVVKEAINSLLSSKLVLTNLEKASALTLEATQVKIKNAIEFLVLKYGEVDKELESAAIKKLRKKVSKDIKNLADLQEIEGKNKKTYIVANTLLLEEYVYTKRQVLNNILEEIESKFEYITNGNASVDIDLELKWIDEREHLLNIFKTYGRDLSLDKYLEKLYELKFEVMTYTLDNPISIFSTANSPLENKVYEDIILNMVDCVLNDRLRKLDCFGSKKGQAISIIETLLKDKNNKFKPHKSVRKVGFIFLLYYFRKDIDIFMNEYLEKISTSPLNRLATSMAFQEVEPWFRDFEFDTKLSYKAIFTLIDWNRKLGEIDILKISENKMYYLYELNRLYQANSKYYKLPEGIVTLDYDLLDKNVREKIYRAIIKQSKGKILVCPSTLKEIANHYVSFPQIRNVILRGEVLNYKDFSDITNVILNDGLNHISNHTFHKANIEMLSIPASVKYIGEEAFDWKKIKSLEFRDYENSSILKSKDWLKNIIDKDLKIKSRQILSSRLGEVTHLEELIFTKGQNKIVLNKDDLNDIWISCFFSFSKDSEVNSIEIEANDYEIFLQELNAKILEKSKDNFVKKLK